MQRGEPSWLDPHVQETLDELHSQWLCKFGLQSLTKELNLDRSNVPRKPWHSTIKPHFQYRHPSWISSRDGHIRETCVGNIIPGLFEIKPEEKGDDDQVEEQTCHQNKLPLHHKPGTYITDLATIPWLLFFTADTKSKFQNCAPPPAPVCLPKLTFRQRLIEVLEGS